MFDERHGLIISCDVSTEKELRRLTEETASVEGVAGYKLGFSLGLAMGLGNAVNVIKDITDMPVIYDHQKAGNDIPEMGAKFAETMKNANVDAAILFPFTGFATLREWTKELKIKRIEVMTGGEMTHPSFFDFIRAEAPYSIYHEAAKLGVKMFVVPGTKPQRISEISSELPRNAKLFFPGIGRQGGDMEKALKAAENDSYAIIGAAIYGAPNIREAAKNFAGAINRI
ncbi:MAG: orotidine 5'-phosphate decarboxylase [Candidatus Aenigmarchaeota archaeon]|nr:orotidine 5'-phosphate decarboxylase [Candidatus Aenigmarchaeota archaeon]